VSVGYVRTIMALPRFNTYNDRLCFRTQEAQLIRGADALALVEKAGYPPDAFPETRRILEARNSIAVRIYKDRVVSDTGKIASDYVFVPSPSSANFEIQRECPGHWIEIPEIAATDGGSCYMIKRDTGMYTHPPAGCYCTRGNALCCPGWNCTESFCDYCTPSRGDIGLVCRDRTPFLDRRPITTLPTGEYL